MTREDCEALLDKYLKKLRITPGWDVQPEWVEDAAWRKTGGYQN